MLEDIVQHSSEILKKFVDGQPLTEDERAFLAAIFLVAIKRIETFDKCAKALDECSENLKKLDEANKKCNQELERALNKLNELVETVEKKEKELTAKLDTLENVVNALRANPFLVPKN